MGEFASDSRLVRKEFDRVYNSSVVGAGFVESDFYYRNSITRYWRSLQFIGRLPLPWPAKILEVGGGQVALLRNKLFGDECAVADISSEYRRPLDRENIKFIQCDLLGQIDAEVIGKYDLVVLLEVIEHIPIPAYFILDKLKRLLAPRGILFLTTPNLFRLRNTIRMICGIDYLDRFMMPEPGKGIGHQLEYTAGHLKWQIERAGMELLFLEHDNLGKVGHSLGTKIGRAVLAPLQLRPKWREGLVAAARIPDGVHGPLCK